MMIPTVWTFRFLKRKETREVADFGEDDTDSVSSLIER